LISGVTCRTKNKSCSRAATIVAYFQSRLTGWKCPAAGGLKFGELTDEQKLTDSAARIIISNELGHSREEVTVVYLGR